MDKIYENMNNLQRHLRIFHDTFNNKGNFISDELPDYELYRQNCSDFTRLAEEIGINKQLYSKKGRQMMLADYFEYILLGRGYYSLKSESEKAGFIKLVLRFVNMLMCYEVLTVSTNLRRKLLKSLSSEIPVICDEELFNELFEFEGKVGIANDQEASPELSKYFDSLLPKTAGGLWHELLVYLFLLRHDVGYIIPLLLSQRLLSLHENLVPPDFLIITHDKNIYGIEVGIKKEIQSGAFSLMSNIPTATIDTINSRCSDRCPICKKWILFCDYIVNNYSNLEKEINRNEIKCLESCNIYSMNEIAMGKCPMTKYSRNRASTYTYTHHEFANGLHYHYSCVLANVDEGKRTEVIKSNDVVALKTHYPFYSGIEAILKK